mgnify:FL=1
MARGIDFDYAARIFDNEYIEWQDERYDYGEPRFIVLGKIDNQIHTVVYTWRGGRRRIISARKANQRERDVFYNQA